jgi:GT2 family glycosyltransferase
MRQRPDLTVCICTYNGAKRFGQFLPALTRTLEASELVTELIVVDDGSNDETSSRVAFLAPNAVVITHGHNRGASAARNTAARAATAEWLMFIDDDATVSPEALVTLWFGRRHDQCIVPLVRGPAGELQNSVALSWRFAEPRFNHVARPLPTVVYPVGTCFMLHRDVYWSVGGFDERFFPNYFEDTAFGFQLARRGIQTHMLEGAEVVHYKHGASATNGVPERVQRAIFENRWVFCLTTLTGQRRAIVFALGLPRAAVESIRRHSLGPIRGYLRACRRMRELIGAPRTTASVTGDP